MDCCNYGEYRAHGHAQYPPSWEGYAPYALPYAPYAHGYYASHAHDPYARYSAYRYDYPAHHAPLTEHAIPMDYGPYSAKEARVRRALPRRDARSRTPIQHLPLPQTPPLECGLNGRGPGYCEPQMWHHYQMNVMNGGGWRGAGWPNRGLSCSREQMRYPTDFRSMKVHHPHVPNMVYGPDGRSTPFSMYEESPYSVDVNARHSGSAEQVPVTGGDQPAAGPARLSRERPLPEPRRSPPLEKKTVVPLPAFQQAFGSTEIGKFAEAFSRTEPVLDEASSDTFTFDSFPEWEGLPEPQWPPQSANREIKCEDSF